MANITTIHSPTTILYLVTDWDLGPHLNLPHHEKDRLLAELRGAVNFACDA